MNSWLGPNSQKKLPAKNNCGWLSTGVGLVFTATTLAYILSNIDYSNLRFDLDDLSF